MSKKTTSPKAAEPPAPPVSPALQSEAGATWLRDCLRTAERQLFYGPGEQGWVHNESLRPAIQERVNFLRALVTLLP